ncbi:MAG: hypothetical protein ACKJSG_14810 [Lentisphaeria bacterium]
MTAASKPFNFIYEAEWNDVPCSDYPLTPERWVAESIRPLENSQVDTLFYNLCSSDVRANDVFRQIEYFVVEQPLQEPRFPQMTLVEPGQITLFHVDIERRSRVFRLYIGDWHCLQLLEQFGQTRQLVGRHHLLVIEVVAALVVGFDFAL